jgi:Zn-dependent M28 family amino/carboxypeptidase
MRRRALGAATGLLAVLLVTLFTMSSAAPDESPDESPEAASLRAEVTMIRIHKHLAALQSIAESSGGNRAAGTVGFASSVDYVRQQLASAGYRVQTQTFRYPHFVETAAPVLVGVHGGRTSYTPGTDVRTMAYSGSGDVTARVQPVGAAQHSGCEPADFAGFAPGSIALLRRGGCTFGDKVHNAQQAKAAAVLIMSDGRAGKTDAVHGSLEQLGTAIPVLSVSYPVGAELAAPYRPTIHVATHTVTEFRQAQNVIAETVGGRGDRVAVIGAHLDSVPAGPGINDDGTGVATVLEVAKQLARLNITPRNKVRFAFWGAEELGLLGSEHYVATLTPQQRSDIAVNLNFDMLGSPNYARFVYDGNGDMADPDPAPPGSEVIERVFTNYFAAHRLPVEPLEFDGRSDYAPFAEVGVPVGGVFSGAEEVKTPAQAARYGGAAGQPFDRCYHQSCDTVAGVNDTVLDQFAGAVCEAVLHFALTTTNPRDN